MRSCYAYALVLLAYLTLVAGQKNEWPAGAQKQAEADFTSENFGGLFTTHDTLAKDTLKFQPMPYLKDKVYQKEGGISAWGLPAAPIGPMNFPKDKEKQFFNRVPGMPESFSASLTPTPLMGVRTDSESWLQRDIHPELIPAPRKAAQPLIYRPVMAMLKSVNEIAQKAVNPNSGVAPYPDTHVLVGSLKSKFVDMIDPARPNSGPQSMSILSNPSIPTPPLLAEAPMPPQPPTAAPTPRPLSLMEMQSQAQAAQRKAYLEQRARMLAWKLAHPDPPRPIKTVTTYYSNPAPLSPEWPEPQENPLQTPVYVGNDAQRQLNDKGNFFPQANVEHGPKLSPPAPVIVPEIDRSRLDAQLQSNDRETVYKFNPNDVRPYNQGLGYLRNYHYQESGLRSTASSSSMHTTTTSTTPALGFNNYSHRLGRYRGAEVSDLPAGDIFTEVATNAVTIENLHAEEEALKKRLIEQVKSAQKRVKRSNTKAKAKTAGSSLIQVRSKNNVKANANTNATTARVNTKATAGNSAAIMAKAAHQKQQQQKQQRQNQKPKAQKPNPYASSLGFAEFGTKINPNKKPADLRLPRHFPRPPSMKKLPEVVVGEQNVQQILSEPIYHQDKQSMIQVFAETNSSTGANVKLDIPVTAAAHMNAKPEGFPEMSHMQPAPFPFAKEESSPYKVLRQAKLEQQRRLQQQGQQQQQQQHDATPFVGASLIQEQNSLISNTDAGIIPGSLKSQSQQGLDDANSSLSSIDQAPPAFNLPSNIPPPPTLNL
jgi:hypothetical protein